MADTGADVKRLTDAVAGLFDLPITHKLPPAWRAWTPDGHLLLFESEHEDAARLLVILLSAQLGSRPILLESPEGVERHYRDGHWHTTPDDQNGDHGTGRAHDPAHQRLRLIVTNASPHGA